MPSRLANQVVLVTGASTGIGAACARAFAAEGARLLLAARRLDRMKAAEPALRAAGAADVRLLGLDVRDRCRGSAAIDGAPRRLEGRRGARQQRRALPRPRQAPRGLASTTGTR